jgi:sulfide:quinone oxidoreductase
MKNLVILGAGTAGTMVANRMVRSLDERTWRVTVVDPEVTHLYQPGLLFLPFGNREEGELVRPRGQTLDPRVVWRTQAVWAVDAAAKVVTLDDDSSLPYDYLVIASGSRIRPDLTEGMLGDGWQTKVFDFYSLEGAVKLRDALANFSGGRLLINVVEMPIKCPVAPLEMLFLADAYFTDRGIRDQVEIVYATPLEGAFTKPRASAALGDMLGRRRISVTGDFSVSEVDGAKKVLKGFDGREVPYDLLVSIPVHGGAEAMTRSGLGDAGGWVPTDKHTLRSKAFEDVFVLGDATDLPASKAGAVAHFQSEVLHENVLRHIDGRPLLPAFDGHANCFIETGFGKAMLIDFNYTTEPLPGRFPLPGIGPFTLLEESETNHWGKLAFKWVYWNLLLAGKDLPLDHRMLMAGKWA